VRSRLGEQLMVASAFRKPHDVPRTGHGPTRETCARAAGPSLAAQPAQLASVVSLISSRVCTGSSCRYQKTEASNGSAPAGDDRSGQLGRQMAEGIGDKGVGKFRPTEDAQCHTIASERNYVVATSKRARRVGQSSTLLVTIQAVG
jgi:hypothetical protein